MHPKSRSKRNVFLPLLGFVAASLLLPADALAWETDTEQALQEPATGSLLITPKRVVFSARDRSAEIYLMNNSHQETTYRVELIEMEMDETGRLMELDTELNGPVETSLGRMVRFAPRQVTIAPGERQTVRMFLRKPADLPPGEYRSHLRLRAIPGATETIVHRTTVVHENGFSLRLIALPGIAIPIILRHGPLPATIELSQLAVVTDQGPPHVSLRLERTGQRSVYGDLAALYFPATGKAIQIGEARGVAVYTSVAGRTFSLPLHISDFESLGPGRLRVTFVSRPDVDGGGGQITATSETSWP